MLLKSKMKSLCFAVFLLVSLIFSVNGAQAVVLIPSEKGVLIAGLSKGTDSTNVYNPQDACIHETGTHSDGQPATGHWAVTTKSGTSTEGMTYNANSHQHWFDVNLNGTYNLSDFEIGLRMNNTSNGTVKVNVFIQLVNSSNQSAGTIQASVYVTGNAITRFRMSDGWPSGGTVPIKNVTRFRVITSKAEPGDTNDGNGLCIYYINAYRQFKTTDGFGVFNNMSASSLELTYDTIATHHINAYYENLSDISYTFNGVAATYFSTEHIIVNNNTDDLIRLTPLKATNNSYSVTVRRKETRRFTEASFTITVTKINRANRTITLSKGATEDAPHVLTYPAADSFRVTMSGTVDPGIVSMPQASDASFKTEQIAYTYTENFDATANGSLPEGYRLLVQEAAGTAEVQNGALVVDATTGSTERRVLTLPAESLLASDFIFEADATFLQVNDGGRWLSLIYCMQGGVNPNYLQMAVRQTATTANGVEFAHHQLGSGWDIPYTASYTEALALNKIYRLKVVGEGGKIRLYINDKLLIESSQIAYPAGGFGLGLAGCKAKFDNIRISGSHTAQTQVTTTPTATTDGVVSATITVPATSNYFETTATYYYQIDKGTIHYTAEDYTGVYDGAPHGITVTVQSPDGTTVKYGTSSDNVTSDSHLLYTDVGDYTEYFTIEKTYYHPVAANRTVTITRAPIAKPTAENRTYNGMAQYCVDPAGALGFNYAGSLKATDTGSYSVTATLDGNHMWADGTTDAIVLPWSMAQKPITITAKNQTITYGESLANDVNQVTVETLASGDSLAGITLTPGGSNAGETTITPSAATIKKDSTDVTKNYLITYQNGTLTINRAPVNKPVAVDRTYNGMAQYGVEPVSGVGYSYSGVTSESRAGVYSATATLDSNHMWSDSTTDALTLHWTMAKRQVTPVLTANDRLYNGTDKANGFVGFPEKIAGDDLFASYVACTFDSPLVGTRTATATGIRLNGRAIDNYELVSETATDTANITKAVLTVYAQSDLVNMAQEALMKEKTTQAGAAENIALPPNYTIENATGSYGSINDETYTRSGVYYNALGVIEDTFVSELVIETIPCVTVTYHITTGQNAVYGDNTTDANEQTTITAYTSTADTWQTENKARKIATDSQATATLNVYLKEGEHLLVNTAIGVYYGRMDVTVTNVNESTPLAEDKIDAFFPANHEDDFRVSKLNEAKPSEQKTGRGDYWKEVNPFIAPSTGVYTFTITVTGKSYLHSLDARYTTNLPAQKPVTELLKFTINGTEMHGIDAQIK